MVKLFQWRATFRHQPWLLRRALADLLQLAIIMPVTVWAMTSDGFYTAMQYVPKLDADFELHRVLTAATVILTYLVLFLFRRFEDINREVVRQHAREARASALARRDPLTGLFNRRHLNETLAEEIMAANSGGEAFALFLLDLDRFKPVNDLFGHAAGDSVLKQVGQRLGSATGDASCVARIGGDEFAAIVTGKANAKEVSALADRILRHFEAPFDVGGKPLRIGASIGIAFYPSAGDDAEALFRHADVALYNAKRQGRNRHCLYAEDMEEGLRDTADFALDIKRGLRDDEFIPYFQPLVDLRSNRIIGLEVLARWKHPVHGLIQPDRFIPVAEALNLIADVTFQVMRKACIAACGWEKDYLLTFNISQTQLRDQWLPERILAVLTETGFPASRIEVEITENSLVEDIDVARAILFSLKNQGMRIALDDFGTGYSSLIHLRDLPLDKIKIDKSFVMSLRNDIGSAKIVSAILGLVTSLGLPTVAEGIESEDVAKILFELGCSYGQGYLYSRPVSADQVVERFIEPELAEREEAVAKIA